ncbi:MAG: TetR/AcrR family transcriptional regulator [bacterium]
MSRDCDKRQAILAAARRAITEHGYARATVEDIAAEAGVAKGTVYLYFKDKADIVDGLVAQTLDDGLATVRANAAREAAPVEKLKAVFAGWAEMSQQSAGGVSLSSPDAIQFASLDVERLERVVRPRMRAIIEALVEIIRPGIASGDFRSVNPYLVAALLIHYFPASILVERQQLPVENPLEEALDAYLHGILAAPSPKENR